MYEETIKSHLKQNLKILDADQLFKIPKLSNKLVLLTGTCTRMILFNLKFKLLLESSIFLAKLRTLYGTLFGALFFLLLATSEAEKGINQDFKSQEKRLNDDHFIHVYYHVHIKVKKIKLKLIKKTILKIYYCAAGIYSITDMCIKRVMAINFLSSNLWLALAKFKKKKPVF